MPKVQIHFKTNVQSEATFEGVIEPDGISGYKFSGILTASCGLDRSGVSFKNTVRFQHGGSASGYNDIDFILEGRGDNQLTVKGEGTREPNDTVDFRISFNEGLSGQFPDGSTSFRKNVTPGGPWQKIAPIYIDGNGLYDIRFDGRARADGPEGYVIEGTFDAAEGPGALTTQRATFCYKTSSESWSDKTYDCQKTPVELKLAGSRKTGDKLHVQVGATSGLANTYNYGSEVTCELPDLF
ncbi:hypothetical protein V2T44_07545 [Serratia ficaria]|uniref:hypothetical protein n=1 Tax=Serratia ficaria TaxID=61651 RepID=UPI002ED3376E|nr:hypothetical protein [Serratia ficaria]